MNEELKVKISAEIGNFKKGMQDAKESLSKFMKQSESASKFSRDALGKMSDIGTKALEGMGTAIAGAGTALLGLGASTREYQQDHAKLTSAFEAAGMSAGQAEETFNGLFRVLGEDDTAVEAANHLAKLTTNQKDLQEWTNICQGVYATFGDSLPIEGLTEAANETTKTGVVTGSLADALNWAGISEDEFNEKLAKCNTEAEREQMIREALSGAYDEAAANYEKNAAAVLAQNEAQAKLNKVMGDLGIAIAPVLTALMTFASEALQPVIDKIGPLAEQYAPQLSEAMGDAGEAVGNAFGFFVDNIGVIGAIAGIIAAITAAIIIYNTYLAIQEGLVAAKIALDLAQSASLWAVAAAAWAALAPHLLIVAAIALVIAAIVLVVANWDWLVGVVSGAWDAICSATSSAVDAVVKFFTNLGKDMSNAVSSAVDAVVGFFSGLWNGLVSIVSGIFSAVSGAFNNVKTAMGNAINTAKTTVINIFNGIKSGITTVVNGVKSTVSNVFNAIKSAISTPINAAKSTVLNVFNAIKSGISDKINAAKSTVSSAIDKIKSVMNFHWKLPELKLPHISISGEFSLNPPRVPSFGISWYAKGGVFDSPTLFPFGNGRLGGLGEAGAEAIVPLEKNTKWLDKIAEKLGSNGPSQIVLEVDGKVFAKTAINSINDLTRQQGKLSLVLA